MQVDGRSREVERTEVANLRMNTARRWKKWRPRALRTDELSELGSRRQLRITTRQFEFALLPDRAQFLLLSRLNCPSPNSMGYFFFRYFSFTPFSQKTEETFCRWWNWKTTVIPSVVRPSADCTARLQFRPKLVWRHFLNWILRSRLYWFGDRDCYTPFKSRFLSNSKFKCQFAEPGNELPSVRQ